MRRLSAALLTILTLTACDSATGPERIDTASIRFFHAIADASAVTFSTSGQRTDTLDYRRGSIFFGREPIAYTVSARLDLVEANLASVSTTLENDKWYTAALVGTRNAPEIVVFENPIGESVADTALVQVAHLSAASPAVDVYIEASAADLSAANPIGTVAFREALPRAERAPAEDWRISLTSVGNPSDIVYQSEDFSVDGTSNLMLAIIGDPANPGAPLSIVVSGRGASLSELNDVNAVAKLRTIHTARGIDGINVVVADEPTPPLFEGLVFGQVSASVEISPEATGLDFTPADNPGASLLGENVSFSVSVPRARQGFVAINASTVAGMVAPRLIADDLRQLANAARFRVVHSAVAAGAVDVYLVPTGTDLTTVDPTPALLQFPNDSGYLTRVPGDYELIVTSPGDTDPLAGPLVAPLAAGGVYGAFIVTSDDTMGVDLLPVDDLAATD